MAATGTPITHMSICGGGAKSPLWRQMIADVYGIPLTDASTGGGAAILGAVAGGAYPDVPTACAHMVSHGALTASCAENHAAYTAFVERYRSLYRALAADFAALSSL